MGHLDKNFQRALKKIEENLKERDEFIMKFEEIFNNVNNYWRKCSKNSGVQENLKDASVGTEEEKISLCVFKGVVIKDKKFLKKPILRINFFQKSETCRNIQIRSNSKTINFPGN
jgi:hypothetical protein